MGRTSEPLYYPLSLIVDGRVANARGSGLEPARASSSSVSILPILRFLCAFTSPLPPLIWTGFFRKINICFFPAATPRAHTHLPYIDAINFRRCNVLRPKSAYGEPIWSRAAEMLFRIYWITRPSISTSANVGEITRRINCRWDDVWRYDPASGPRRRPFRWYTSKWGHPIKHILPRKLPISRKTSRRRR